MRKPTQSLVQVGYHDLLRDLGRPGCAVCRGAGRAAWHYIDSILWEMVNDASVRARLRAAHGFCREHGIMALSVAEEQAGALGMAIMYEDFLRHVREDAIHEVRDRARSQRRVRGRSKATGLAPHARCPACESATRVSENYLGILAAAVPDSDVWKAARGPQRGLCLPHLRFGIERVGSLEGAERLVELYLHADAELRQELSEFAAKHDYRRQPESFTPAEGTSWVRAVYRLVGERSPGRRPER